MGSAKEDFEFLNSTVWLKYTHERYLDKDETRYRLGEKIPQKEWVSLWERVVHMRKIGSVPIFLKSVGNKFWFYPSDSIQKKIIEIEKLGNQLYDRIAISSTFKEEFLSDAIIEEAITSAIYEGANTTRAQAKQLIESGKRPANKDEWMLLNNYEAMNWIKEHREDSVTEDLILKIHQIVTKNTLDNANENYCGKFRDDKVYVHGRSGKIIHEGIDFNQINSALEESIRTITNHPRFLHPLVRGILFHYLIAFIHPFFDGNGRTARTLFYFKSMKHRLHFVELLSISAHLKNTGNQYESSFERVKNHDWDLTYFVNYCLESLLSALKVVNGKVSYLLSIMILKEQYSLTDNQVGLLQTLALNKYMIVTIEKYAKKIHRSREIARQELKQLAKYGFLKEQKSGKKFVYRVESKFLKEKVQTAQETSMRNSSLFKAH